MSSDLGCKGLPLYSIEKRLWRQNNESRVTSEEALAIIQVALTKLLTVEVMRGSQIPEIL